MKVRYEDVIKNRQIAVFIEKADMTLAQLGYTEHSFVHAGRVTQVAGMILKELEFSERDVELAKIAGYMHDIGNVINRADHAQSGAIMAYRLLDNMGMEAADIAQVITAIGNHDENTAYPVDAVTAALIIGDKTDVRSSRVRN